MTGLKKVRLILALLACSALIPSSAGANSFTLEQVMSSPFPAELVASPRGDKIAWVFDARGKRNIWVADAPAFKGRQLTRYDKDDGQEITELKFSPDGNWIAYVRGGPPNADGEIPNPSSDPTGAAQEVWVVGVRTGALVRIGEGTSPFFSPRGDRVLFTREDRLWWAPAAGGGTAKKLFEIRGGASSPSWSPDGSQLAFISERGDHSFVTLYDTRWSKLRMLQASVDRDILPRWSPDGSRIAFIRLINVADTFSIDKERITPWAIWVVDAVTGKGREIWKSGVTEMDSFSSTPQEHGLHWAGNDRLVFASEKSGWAHLYSIPASGGNESALTSGNYEVENAAWSPDRSFVIVSSNSGDSDRRHLWRVNIGGGTQQITRGASIEMYPVVIDGGRKVAFFKSTGREPLMPHVASIDGANQIAVAPDAIPREFPVTGLAEPEQVIFKAADGLPIHGQVFKPASASGKLPAVVYLHGGPIRQMLLGWHYLYYYNTAYAFNQYLASRGYIVLSVNFRGGVGYGRAFREAKGRGARGASEHQDVVAAGKYLQSRNDVDVSRIGLWGGSYGGYLTALGLGRNSDIFAAGVDIHGVHDWSARSGRAAGAPIRLIYDSSPISSVDKWKSPVLLIHGDDDRSVPFSQTVELVKKLRERNVRFEQLVLPDEAHDFLMHKSWVDIYRASADFLDRHLR